MVGDRDWNSRSPYAREPFGATADAISMSMGSWLSPRKGDCHANTNSESVSAYRRFPVGRDREASQTEPNNNQPFRMGRIGRTSLAHRNNRNAAATASAALARTSKGSRCEASRNARSRSATVVTSRISPLSRSWQTITDLLIGLMMR